MYPRVCRAHDLRLGPEDRKVDQDNRILFLYQISSTNRTGFLVLVKTVGRGGLSKSYSRAGATITGGGTEGREVER